MRHHLSRDDDDDNNKNDDDDDDDDEAAVPVDDIETQRHAAFTGQALVDWLLAHVDATPPATPPRASLCKTNAIYVQLMTIVSILCVRFFFVVQWQVSRLEFQVIATEI